MNSRLWPRLALSALLVVTPFSQAESQNSVGDMINILLGAYNGAATAMAENTDSEAQLLNKEDLSEVEALLEQYQGQLKALVKDDGSIDVLRLGHFLNRLQNEQQGNINYDFVQALKALQDYSPSNEPRDILNTQVVAQLVDAAKNEELNQQIGQVIPFLSAMLQMSETMSGGGRQDAGFDAELAILRHLAEQASQPKLKHTAEATIAKLKILYADQRLGAYDAAAVEQSKKALNILYKQAIDNTGELLPVATYDQIINLLEALGADFSHEREQWIKQRAVARKAPTALQGFDGKTQSLLRELDYEQLPPELQQQLLEVIGQSKSE
ncbi:hypothetical protein L0B52_03750 [Suttonella sp. R2A3]|uniref:hypothetical protein n=1 Tax=Suttonella sp. R2A3 TaxID=2908648 RepID=UPI001F21B8E2|nr:hypothetical protein [Suttonella sp. R2A3]UJF25274.1 hypothetical protein L0B52_03750 [Suttonella sp. R2A3]